MSIKFAIVGGTGLDLAAIVRQVNANGTLGNYWDDVNQLYAPSPTDTNKKIALSEGTGLELGRYYASRTALGTYTGEIVAFIINNGTGQTVAAFETYLITGSEVSAGAELDKIDDLALEATSQAIKANTDNIPATPATEATAAAAQSAAASVDAKLTTTRAGYLDLLPTIDSEMGTTLANTVTIAADTGNILADTAAMQPQVNTLATDFANGTGRLDGFIVNINTKSNTVEPNVAAILADTNWLETQWNTGGTLRTSHDGHTASLSTIETATAATLVDTADMQPRIVTIESTLGELGTVDNKIDAIQADVTLILADTAAMQPQVNTLATDWGVGGTLTLQLGGVAADTDLILSDTSAILTDTADIQPKVTLLATDWGVGGTLTNQLGQVAIDADLAKTDTADMRPRVLAVETSLADGGFHNLLVDAIQGDLTTVLADTAAMQPQVNTLHTDWIDGGRLDTLLDTAAGGGVAVTFATAYPTRERTWYLKAGDDTLEAPNIIHVGQGGTYKLAMDFSDELASGTGVLLAVSAQDAALAGPITISDVERSQDAKAVMMTITGVVAGNKHQIKVLAQTTDGLTLVGLGNLWVE